MRTILGSQVWALAAATLLGCHSGSVEPTPDLVPEVPVVSEPDPPSAPETTGSPEAAAPFEARLTIDAKPGGKKFQGVWLHVRGKEPMVIDYRPREIWRGFEEARVMVTGESYVPRGQAISAPHFRVQTLRLADQKDPSPTIRALDQEQTLRGRFEERRGEIGSKSEGEVWLVFVSEAGTFLLANSHADARVNVDFKVRGREVEMSPFSTHRGGRHLWVLDIDTEN